MDCTADSFLLDDRNRGGLPEGKQFIIDMSLNASGVRDTARSLHIRTDTVFRELKKKEPVSKKGVPFFCIPIIVCKSIESDLIDFRGLGPSADA